MEDNWGCSCHIHSIQNGISFGVCFVFFFRAGGPLDPGGLEDLEDT